MKGGSIVARAGLAEKKIARPQFCESTLMLAHKVVLSIQGYVSPLTVSILPSKTGVNRMDHNKESARNLVHIP